MDNNNHVLRNYSAFEMSRIFGEPRDPRQGKSFSNLVTAICETDTVGPRDYYYYFDALLETDKVYVITATGEVTQENVSPDTPAVLSFTDLASPEYYVKITDLASTKESTIARKIKTINRAMNFYENYKIVALLSAAVTGLGINSDSFDSSEDHFDYSHLIDMLHSVKDYGNSFVLLVGSTIDKQIDLWDWTDNKYHSLKDALADLNVEIIRVKESVTIDGSATDVLAATDVYLVARNTEMGKPVMFVRKQLDEIELLGGIIKEQDGERPQRIIFASPNPVSVLSTSKRYLAVGITGYEQFAAAVTNPYAIAYFSAT